jgi:hypothetical protein
MDDQPQASGATEEKPAWVPDPASARVESQGRGAPPDDLPSAGDERIDTGLGDPNEEPDQVAAGGDDEPLPPDSSREVVTRPYVVLEELLVVDVVSRALAHLGEAPLTEEQRTALGSVVTYRRVDEVPASNGVHALRRAAKANFEAGQSPNLVAVSARNMRAKPVAVSADTRVSVG